jgi:CheY-like chemotaxis protein
MNLAINARDAMPDGGKLTISITDHKVTADDLADQEPANPGDYVDIAVADTGIGMTPEVLSRAIEPFFTTKPIGQGTGLGLSQVYGFVRQSGGFLRVDSLPGQGTSVIISMPASPRPQHAMQDWRKPSGALTAPSSARGVVLVVEDQPEVRAQIVEVLAAMGCEIIEAVDGVEGLRIVDQRPHLDLLVTDVGIPGLSGRQLADAARKAMPALPILFITGYAGAALDAIPLTDGMEMMRKPFSLDELAARVAAMLTGSTGLTESERLSVAPDFRAPNETKGGP